MKFWSTLILFSLISALGSSGTKDLLPISKILCERQAKEILSQWKASHQWYAQPSTDPALLDFRSPTALIGTWVEVKGNSKVLPQVSRLTAHTKLTVTYIDECVPTENWEVIPSKDDGFTDDLLRSLLAKNEKGGVILLWSPQMPYSLDAVKNIEEATQDTHVPLKLVLDSAADEKSALESARKLKIPSDGLERNASLELSNRGMELHFPSMIIYKNGKIASPMLPGFSTTTLYKKFIHEYLK